MEAPQGVEPTGTNGETRHTTHPQGWEGITTAKTARNTRDTEQRSVTAERQTSVHHPVPNPPTTGKPTGSPTTQDLRRPWPRGDARTPFRTRKLRPGTAMVLHPTGRGRVARRRTIRTKNPRSSHTRLPGVLRIPEPTRTGKHPATTRTPHHHTTHHHTRVRPPTDTTRQQEQTTRTPTRKPTGENTIARGGRYDPGRSRWPTRRHHGDSTHPIRSCPRRASTGSAPCSDAH